MGDDAELEQIKRRKIEELQRQQQMAEQQEEMKAEADMQRQGIMRQLLTSEARERLARMKIARPEFVEQVENQLIMLAQSGQLKEQLDDATLVKILERLTPEKREITIKRK